MADALADGKAAWARLRNDRKGWTDWLAVGRALQIGRTEAMKIAKTNRPVGSGYNREMGRWLVEHGLDSVSAQERYRLGMILQHLTEIGTWRAGLDDAKRRRLNHPNAIWAHWCRSIKPPTAPRQALVVTDPAEIVHRVVGAGDVARSGRPVYWSQQALRRAHGAMLDSKSSDLLTLARAALQAAVRDQNDLLALLEPAKSNPQQRSAVAHAA